MAHFAPIANDFSYWQKQTQPLFAELSWNIPEQKTGQVTVIGGNSQNFSAIIRISEFLSQNFPFQQVSTLLPDSLRNQLPPLSNLNFAPSTTSGSFAKSAPLNSALSDSSSTILAGDLSRNSATAIALTEAITSSLKSNATPAPLLITRDAVDLLAPSSDQILQHPSLFLVASMAQLQKVFRAVYYPKMILLSEPLVPVIETLHKFTLTYPTTILTFHQDQILVANSGHIVSTPITRTTYSPLSLWSGQLAAKITAFNLYNPNKPLEATTAAVLFA